MHNIGNTHSNIVSPLMKRPAIGYFFDSPLNNATMHKMNARGGPNMMRIPTRNPSGEPQPNPGTPAIAHRIKIHGDAESQNPLLPVFIFFIF